MNKKGFLQIIPVIIAGLVLVAAGGSAWYFKQPSKRNQGNGVLLPVPVKQTNPKKVPKTSAQKEIIKPTTPISKPANLSVIWQYNGSEWRPLGTAPNCPNPFALLTPVDLSQVTSILYPGQIRGDNYKAHGGFRFDNSSEGSIIVRAPYDAMIVAASRSIENNEVQYLFDFQLSCGIQYRFEHLKVLSPELQAVADKLPEAKVNDTRTTFINPPVRVSTNDVLATKVGITGNTFLDWGVYDLRQKNKVSQDPSWAAVHPNNSLAPYAVCWFDLLSSNDAITVRSLPGAGASGKTSDYCK